MKDDARSEFNRRLDAALADYASVEPPAGLEQRILARARTSEARPRLVWWRWAAAVPALACAVAVFVYRDAPRIEPPRVALTAPPAPVLSAPLTKRTSRPRPVRLPKLEVFPTPVPLSAEERALLMLVAQSPEKASELLTPAEPEPIKPIEIEPISNGG